MDVIRAFTWFQLEPSASKLTQQSSYALAGVPHLSASVHGGYGSPHGKHHNSPGKPASPKARGAHSRFQSVRIASWLWRWRERTLVAALSAIVLLYVAFSDRFSSKRPFKDAKCFACSAAPNRLPPDTRVLIAVNSYCGNADNRKRIRNSWMPRARPLGIGVQFFVARNAHCSDEAIAEEQRAHGDVVVLPLNESYDQLTVKTHALLLHAAALSPPVDLLLKVDDDIYVDPHRFAGRLWQLAADGALARGVYGGFFHNATIVMRDPANKWCDGDYPLAHYPPYASGAAYYLSRPALQYLARAGREGALLTGWHNEDASVGSWLFGTVFTRFHDEGVLRCLDCATNVFHQPPWAMHVADNLVWTEEARSSPAPAHLMQARRSILEEAWKVIHGRVVRGALMRGECCPSSTSSSSGEEGGGGEPSDPPQPALPLGRLSDGDSPDTSAGDGLLLEGEEGIEPPVGGGLARLQQQQQQQQQLDLDSSSGGGGGRAGSSLRPARNGVADRTAAHLGAQGPHR